MTDLLVSPLNAVDRTCIAPPYGNPYWCNTHLREHDTPTDRAGVEPTPPPENRPAAIYRVTCTEHALDRAVDTPTHAFNLAALHNRVDHPDAPPLGDPADLNLTAAAEWLLVLEADPHLRKGSGWTAALTLWQRLTGIEDDLAAVRYARHVRDTPTRAAVIPF